jgi:hypothetical protein
MVETTGICGKTTDLTGDKTGEDQTGELYF